MLCSMARSHLAQRKLPQPASMDRREAERMEADRLEALRRDRMESMEKAGKTFVAVWAKKIYPFIKEDYAATLKMSPTWRGTNAEKRAEKKAEAERKAERKAEKKETKGNKECTEG